MIDVNLTGVWRTCVAAVPSMIAAGNGGSVILTSSVAGLTPFRNAAHYVASKFGVVGLMKCLALELAEHMIRVNSVNPTTVDTPMVINEPTLKMFLPESESPTKEDFGRRHAGEPRAPGPVGRIPRRRPTPCCSSPPTRRGTSRA